MGEGAFGESACSRRRHPASLPSLLLRPHLMPVAPLPPLSLCTGAQPPAERRPHRRLPPRRQGGWAGGWMHAGVAAAAPCHDLVHPDPPAPSLPPPANSQLTNRRCTAWTTFQRCQRTRRSTPQRRRQAGAPARSGRARRRGGRARPPRARAAARTTQTRVGGRQAWGWGCFVGGDRPAGPPPTRLLPAYRLAPAPPSPSPLTPPAHRPPTARQTTRLEAAT